MGFPLHSIPLQGVERSYYDVVIVGSGPAGACLGYYLVKKGRKVLTLEKKTFPRDKICGDALCKTGIEILMEMGLYEKLLKENKAHIVSCMRAINFDTSTLVRVKECKNVKGV